MEIAKSYLTLCLGALVLLFDARAGAAVLYVDANSSAPAAPYTNWNTAAGSIQDAVDAANPGDTVLVTNGAYYTGGAADEYGVSNRVAVTKPITVQSVNGASATTIQGDQLIWYYYPYISYGTDIRCVYLTNGAALSGFTLTGAAATGNGGGAFCESTNATLTDCVIMSNSTASGEADSGGGGVFSGTLINCSISNNISTGYGTGGGVSGSVLTNCILANNSAFIGGGAEESTLYNCVVTGNSGSHSGTDDCTLYDCVVSYNLNGGASGGTLNNCALYGNQSFAAQATMNNCTVIDNPGIGNLGGNANNCILYYNSGGNSSGGTLNYCCTTPLPTNGAGNITNEPAMASLTHLSLKSPCIGAGSSAYATGVDIDSEAWGNPPSSGCDEIHAGAVTGPLSVNILADNIAIGAEFPVHFTAQITGRTTGSVWDFDDGTVISNMPAVTHTWSASGTHPVVLKVYNESYPNGVTATQLVEVVTQLTGQFFVSIDSTNPTPPYTNWATAATTIQDAVNAAFPGTVVLVSNGVYQTGGEIVHETTSNRVAITKPLTVASLNGPTVTMIVGDGKTRCAYLTNGASLVGFTLTGGQATIGNPNTAEYDRLGGGFLAEDNTGTVLNCIITQCEAAGFGGGAWRGTLVNCLVTGNTCSGQGGGTYNSNLRDSIVVQNSAEIAGGTAWGLLENCIVYYNQSNPFPQSNYLNCTFINSCTAPDSGGIDDITNAPLFVDQAGGDFHLQSNSPCINAGDNDYVSNATDLDYNPRIVGGTVDIGAYEYQTPTSIISYAWLDQYGLPLDGSADFEDLDGTGMKNWQKWIAGLNPTNSASVLAMLPTTNNSSGTVVSWQSVTNITYFLQRSTNLEMQPAFTTIQSNIAGQSGTTSFADSNAIGSGPYFYRVGVQR